MTTADELVKNLPSLKEKFIKLCHDNKAYKYGNFTLRCGTKSNVFFNTGDLSDAETYDVMTDLIVAKLIESGLEFDAVIGLPYKGISIVSVVCVKYFKATGKKIYFGYYRKEVKTHGEGSLFVGAPFVFSKGTRVVIIDDVLTTGDAKESGLKVLENLELNIVSVLILLNREFEYGKYAKKLKERNIGLLEVLRLGDIIDPNTIKYNEW